MGLLIIRITVQSDIIPMSPSRWSNVRIMWRCNRLKIIHHPHVFMFQVMTVEHKRAVPSPVPHSNPRNRIGSEYLSVVQPMHLDLVHQVRHIVRIQ